MNNLNNSIVNIKISGCNIKILKRKPLLTTLNTIYGVGKLRASKINSLLLNNPRIKVFKEDLISLAQDTWVQKLFKSFVADDQLKLTIFSNLDSKFQIRCYQGIRILQNLPSRGQRTHTNSGTPKRINPFIKLGIKEDYVAEVIANHKKWELTRNDRSNDLVTEDFNVKKKRKFNKGVKQAKEKEKIKKAKEKAVRAKFKAARKAERAKLREEAKEKANETVVETKNK